MLDLLGIKRLQETLGSDEMAEEEREQYKMIILLILNNYLNFNFKYTPKYTP